MSHKALPILFINLSGEMMYILDQRLRAQNIQKEKSAKVMNDIVKTMFNDLFIAELFKPQPLYTKDALRTVFEKLAHSSIMRLNGTSMDKLYDLMTMVFKYQLCLCPRPEDVLLITLNHLDGIRMFNQGSPEVLALIDNVYCLLIENYGQMTSGKFQFLRSTLLTFFQDLQIRVSVLLKEGCQRTNGKFASPRGGPVPFGFRVPGTICVLGTDGSVVKTVNFPTADTYEPPLSPGSVQMNGDRVTKLGKNIYLEHELLEKERAKNVLLADNAVMEANEISNSSGCEELSFLARLIGQSKSPLTEFTLGIFDENVNDATTCVAYGEDSTIVNIDAFQRMEEHTLHKIMGELTVEEKETEEQDLLELLDVASS